MHPIPAQASWHLGTHFPTNVLVLCLRDPTFLTETYDCLHSSYFGDQGTGGSEDLVMLAEMVLTRFVEVTTPPTRDELLAMAYEKAKVLDKDGSLGLQGRFQGWIDHLFSKEIPEVDFVKKKVRDFGRMREIIQAVNQILFYLESDSPDKSEETIEKISNAMNSALTVGTGRDFGSKLHELGPSLPQKLREDQLYGLEHKVPTGIRTLDQIMNGGAGVGEICVVAGPPNRGKSTVLAALGRHAAGHFMTRSHSTGIVKAVVHITCEMHENDIALKYMSNMTGVPQNEVMMSEDYDVRQTAQLPLHSPVIIKYFSPGTATVDDIKWFLANLVMVDKITPGLLVLDYADRLKGGEDDRFRGMGKIYDELIALGDKFNIPVWTGSQINRDKSESKVIKSDGIAESWKKIEAADLVMTLCQDDAEYEQGIMRLHMAKVRRGRAKDTIYCRYQPETATIWEMNEDEMAGIGHAPKPEEGVDTNIPAGEVPAPIPPRMSSPPPKPVDVVLIEPPPSVNRVEEALAPTNGTGVTE